MSNEGAKTTRRQPTGRRRLRSQERRAQILDVTLDLVAEHGITGTTLTRIAAAVGVTTPALYAHFANRKEILLAALDLLMERRTALHRVDTQGTAVERLREIGHRHSHLVASETGKSVVVLFEFIAAPAQEGLRETLGQKHLLLAEVIAAVVREGQREGSIIAEADPEQIAWMLLSRAWTEDIAQLMGVSEVWNEQRSNQMLEFILASIAVSD